MWRTQTGPRVALGTRIVEAPEDFDRFELRDPSISYIAYVPEGAIARGRALALTANVRVAPCRSCHGSDFKGALGPPLAGRFPRYIFRQLLVFHAGTRRGASGQQMIEVTKSLSQTDMIVLAAFPAAQRP